jgi:hypothetical protein
MVDIDRRIIFLTVFLAAAVPMVIDIPLTVTIEQDTRNFFQTISDLERGDVIVLSMDYSPETRPEIDPMAEAVLRHCFHEGVKVIGMVNTIPNIPVGEDVMRKAAGEVAVYGEDYVYLGFKPELRALIISFSEDFRKSFPEDYYHTPLDEIPMMKGVHSLEDLALAVAVTSDDVSFEWLLTANSRFDVRVIMGVGSNYYPSFMPYIESGQILGALGGMKGAAEYETLLAEAGILPETGEAMRGMATQSSVHLLILFYILLGNVGYFAARRKGA